MRLIKGLYLFIYLFGEVRPLWNWSTQGKCLSVVQLPMRQWITLLPSCRLAAKQNLHGLGDRMKT